MPSMVGNGNLNGLIKGASPAGLQTLQTQNYGIQNECDLDDLTNRVSYLLSLKNLYSDTLLCSCMDLNLYLPISVLKNRVEYERRDRLIRTAYEKSLEEDRQKDKSMIRDNVVNGNDTDIVNKNEMTSSTIMMSNDKLDSALNNNNYTLNDSTLNTTVNLLVGEDLIKKTYSSDSNVKSLVDSIMNGGNKTPGIPGGSNTFLGGKAFGGNVIISGFSPRPSIMFEDQLSVDDECEQWYKLLDEETKEKIVAGSEVKDSDLQKVINSLIEKKQIAGMIAENKSLREVKKRKSESLSKDSSNESPRRMLRQQTGRTDAVIEQEEVLAPVSADKEVTHIRPIFSCRRSTLIVRGVSVKHSKLQMIELVKEALGKTFQNVMKKDVEKRKKILESYIDLEMMNFQSDSAEHQEEGGDPSRKAEISPKTKISGYTSQEEMANQLYAHIMETDLVKRLLNPKDGSHESPESWYRKFILELERNRGRKKSSTCHWYVKLPTEAMAIDVALELRKIEVPWETKQDRWEQREKKRNEKKAANNETGSQGGDDNSLQGTLESGAEKAEKTLLKPDPVTEKTNSKASTRGPEYIQVGMKSETLIRSWVPNPYTNLDSTTLWAPGPTNNNYRGKVLDFGKPKENPGAKKNEASRMESYCVYGGYNGQQGVWSINNGIPGPVLQVMRGESGFVYAAPRGMLWPWEAPFDQYYSPQSPSGITAEQDRDGYLEITGLSDGEPNAEANTTEKKKRKRRKAGGGGEKVPENMKFMPKRRAKPKGPYDGNADDEKQKQEEEKLKAAQCVSTTSGAKKISSGAKMNSDESGEPKKIGHADSEAKTDMSGSAPKLDPALAVALPSVLPSMESSCEPIVAQPILVDGGWLMPDSSWVPMETFRRLLPEGYEQYIMRNNEHIFGNEEILQKKRHGKRRTNTSKETEMSGNWREKSGEPQAGKAEAVAAHDGAVAAEEETAGEGKIGKKGKKGEGKPGKGDEKGKGKLGKKGATAPVAIKAGGINLNIGFFAQGKGMELIKGMKGQSNPFVNPFVPPPMISKGKGKKGVQGKAIEGKGKKGKSVWETVPVWNVEQSKAKQKRPDTKSAKDFPALGGKKQKDDTAADEEKKDAANDEEKKDAANDEEKDNTEEAPEPPGSTRLEKGEKGTKHFPKKTKSKDKGFGKAKGKGKKDKKGKSSKEWMVTVTFKSKKKKGKKTVAEEDESKKTEDESKTEDEEAKPEAKSDEEIEAVTAVKSAAKSADADTGVAEGVPKKKRRHYRKRIADNRKAASASSSLPEDEALPPPSPIEEEVE